MKNYKFYVKNSNGTESLFRERVLSGDDEAEKMLKELESNGFDYRYEAGEDVDSEEMDDAIENGDVDTEDTEDVEYVEEDESEELDLDWEDESDEDDFPRGWHRRNEFVAKDGTVYNQGEVQEDLFRTLEPSDY